MATNYMDKINSAKEDYELINSEYKELLDMRERINTNIKALDDADPNEVSIKQYNDLVNEVNDDISEYNERAKVVRDLVRETYKFKGENMN